MNILVTGGLGYIGLDLSVELLKDHNVIILDNLSIYLNKIDYIFSHSKNHHKYMNASLTDLDRLYGLFRDIKLDYIIHCASYKSIRESIIEPFKYYNNNITSVLNLISLAKRVGCKNIINCSSGSIYESGDKLSESSIINPLNPYSKIKTIEEGLFKDLYNSDSTWNITNLRIFNPINPTMYKVFGPYNDLVGAILTRSKENRPVSLYGNTIRDYFHMKDLIDVFKLVLSTYTTSGIREFNVGSGHGTSIIDLVSLFNNYIDIDYIQEDRKDYEPYCTIADITKVSAELNWYPKYTIEDIVRECCN